MLTELYQYFFWKFTFFIETTINNTIFLLFLDDSCIDILDTPSQFDFTPYTGKIYDCTLTRLKAADLDQEVKERAIFCMGQIIAHLGDHLQVSSNNFNSLNTLQYCWSHCFSKLRL